MAAVAAGHDTRWVLVLPAVLEPMEYWLTHLAATVLEPKSGLTAAKSVALDTEGNIACAGLQHQHAVVGDASLLTLPFMLLRCAAGGRGCAARVVCVWVCGWVGHLCF